MEIKILGPLQILHNGQEFPVKGVRQRIVLCALLLDANRVIPLDRTICSVWGESPPKTAKTQIQICISSLRRVFAEVGEPGIIVTRAAGYLLQVGSNRFDLLRFIEYVNQARKLTEAGKPMESVAKLKGALALWRGRVAMGIPSDVVQRNATLLEERRLSVLEELYRLQLSLGRHSEIIGELQELVEADPLRETFQGFLMLALYRANRQAEALEVYRRARAVLDRELGIEPSRRLQELEMAVLNSDPQLNCDGEERDQLVLSGDGTSSWTDGSADDSQGAGVHSLRQLPAGIADFTGREQQLAEARDHMRKSAEALESRRLARVLHVTGQGGVGKSTFALRLAHDIRDGFPDGQLYTDLRAGPYGGSVNQALASFLRSLGIDNRRIPEEPNERAAMFRSLVADKRILVVLDSVEDERHVRPLLPGSMQCGVIVAARSRRAVLPGVHNIHLDLFSSELSLELLSHIIGRDRVEGEPEAARELVALCAGLPLAVRIVGAKLASRPHWPVLRLVRRLRNEATRLDELAHHDLEIRSIIEMAYKSLGWEAQRLFRLCAALETGSWPGWVAASLLDVEWSRAEELLERLVEAQLVEVLTDGENPRYRFHDLVRAYAREQLLVQERPQTVHEAVERTLSGWLVLSEEAHRREYGGDFTIVHGAAERYAMPPEEVACLTESPMSWWESERESLVAAVRQAAGAGLSELCWDLVLNTVTLYEAKGYFDEWREASQIALDISVRAGNYRGQAAMLYSLGTLHMYQKSFGRADKCFGEAMDLLRVREDRHLEGLLLRNMAFMDRVRGELDAMFDKYEIALGLFRDCGDEIAEAHVLNSLAKVSIDRGDLVSSRSRLEEALKISRTRGCQRVEAQVVFRLGELHLREEDLPVAEDCFSRALHLVRRKQDPIGEAHALYGLGLVQKHHGSDLAEGTLRDAIDRSRHSGERLVEAQALLALGQVSLARGGRAASLTHFSSALALFESLSSETWAEKAREHMRAAEALDRPGLPEPAS